MAGARKAYPLRVDPALWAAVERLAAWLEGASKSLPAREHTGGRERRHAEREAVAKLECVWRLSGDEPTKAQTSQPCR